MAKAVIDIEAELQRTNPDFVVYVPRSTDGSTGDTGNEHFLVFEGPGDALSAVWTQSTYEGEPDQRIAFSRSKDGGNTWQPPKTIASRKGHKGMASWGFPMLSRSGRIYVVYSRHIGVNDIFRHMTGLMGCVYSDDAGESWSTEQTIPMPRDRWDNPDPEMPLNWIVWQKPLRLPEGKYFAGFTKWVSPAVRPPAPIKVWWAEASVIEFLRFENLDDDPEPADLRVSYFAQENEAVQVPLIGHPDVPVAQEPSVVSLPDGRLFCTMRTTTGFAYYTVSGDAGLSWTDPQPLRQTDTRLPLRHPCSPCPIYQVSEGEYIFLFHNHDGHFGGWGPRDSDFHRRPLYVARGLFRPEARQPVWFSEPVLLMDNDGVPLLRTDLAMYASVTATDDGVILWYPERKFFLLGKKITREWLSQMTVPDPGD